MVVKKTIRFLIIINTIVWAACIAQYARGTEYPIVFKHPTKGLTVDSDGARVDSDGGVLIGGDLQTSGSLTVVGASDLQSTVTIGQAWTLPLDQPTSDSFMLVAPAGDATWTTATLYTPITNHNDLSGIDGAGTYHITAGEAGGTWATLHTTGDLTSAGDIRTSFTVTATGLDASQGEIDAIQCDTLEIGINDNATITYYEGGANCIILLGGAPGLRPYLYNLYMYPMGDAATNAHVHCDVIDSGTLSLDRFSAYDDLTSESKIGTGAAQVAAGDHTHTALGNLSVNKLAVGQTTQKDTPTSGIYALGDIATAADLRAAGDVATSGTATITGDILTSGAITASNSLHSIMLTAIDSAPHSDSAIVFGDSLNGYDAHIRRIKRPGADAFLCANVFFRSQGYDITEYLSVDGIQVITSGRILQNVSADASIITSGTLDNARVNWAAPSAIGSRTPAAGTFTTCAATTFDTNEAAAGVTLSGTTLSADGTDANINIAITPKGTGEVDITKVDINGGTIDGAVIGGGTAAAGTFTTCAATTFDTNKAAAGVTLSGTTLSADGTDANINIAITPKGTGEVDITKVDINSGAIDGTTIGSGTASTGAFTTLSNTDAQWQMISAVDMTPLGGLSSNWALESSGRYRTNSNSGAEIIAFFNVVPGTIITDLRLKGYDAGSDGMDLNFISRRDDTKTAESYTVISNDSIGGYGSNFVYDFDVTDTTAVSGYLYGFKITYLIDAGGTSKIFSVGFKTSKRVQ